MRTLAMHALTPRKSRLRVVQDGREPLWRQRRMARTGLISRTGAREPPALTPAGRGFVLSADLGIQFFEVCVLAKVYGLARVMTGACASGDGAAAPGGTVTIPLRTIRYFFEDWPVHPLRVQHALARLRGRGLLPRSRYKRVACDMARLERIGGGLSEMDRWVDDTGEEMRRVLLHGD